MEKEEKINVEEVEEEVKEEKETLTKKQNAIMMIKFVLFSASAGIIQIGSFTLLYEVLKLIWWASYVISLALSVLWNFTFNREFTFKSANNVPIAMLKVACFYAVFAPTTTLLGDYLTGTLLWNGFLVEAMIMISNLVLEWFYSTLFVYRGSINTNERAKKEKEKESN